MKLIFYIFISLLLFSSCVKNHEALNGPGHGYWVLGFNDQHSDRYNVNNSERNSDGNYFILSGKESASSLNILQIYFQAQPTFSGKYKVVSFTKNPTLMSNEIGIKIYIPFIGTYSSTGISDNVTWLPSPDADVAVNNGKIKVEIPQMTAVISTPAYLDTVFIQARLIEK